MQRPLALVIVRDPASRALIRDVFEEHDVTSIGATTSAEIREALRRHAIRIVVVDCDTPGVDSLEMIRVNGTLTPAPITVALIPAGDAARALELMQCGALDVLTKPLEEPQMQQVIRRTLRHQALADEVRQLREDLQSREGYHGLVGKSAAMERLRERIRILAAASGPVWFVGERGSGRELAARTLHAASGKHGDAFYAVDCNSMTRQSWDTILQATEGTGEKTLYLEDLPALAPDLQGRVLSTLGGGSRRVISSSRQPPAVEMDKGRLNEELFGMLAIETIEIPSLGDRIEDVPLLAQHFIASICAVNQLPPIRLTAETINMLESHRWTENVQELRGAMEHAAILAENGKIVPENLPERILQGTGIAVRHAPGANASLRRFRDAKRDVVESFERVYLCDLMKQYDGNVTAASQRAGMLRSALQRLLRKYGLKSAEFRKQRRPGAAMDDPQPPR